MSLRGRRKTRTGFGEEVVPRRVWSVTSLQGGLRGDLRSVFRIQQQGVFWWPHESYAGGEVGPKVRLKAVGWYIRVNTFYPQAPNQDGLQENPIENLNHRKTPIL